MKNRRQSSDPQCLSPDKDTGHRRGKVVEAIVETSKALTETDRRLRGHVSGVTSRRSEEACGASECGDANRRVPRDGVDNSGLAFV